MMVDEEHFQIVRRMHSTRCSSDQIKNLGSGIGRDDFHFFVTDLFGHETRGIGYQKKHFGLYGKS